MNHVSAYKNDLVLIGGGHSHVAVVKELGMKPLAGLRVTLVSEDSYTPYSGMLPGLIAGHYSFDDCYIDLRKLCQWANVRFIHNAVKSLDPVARKITCHQYPPLSYDLLSINTGSQPALYTINGAANCGHAVKPINKFLSHWRQWLDSAAVNTTNPLQHIVVVGGGAAGVEVLLAMRYSLHGNTQINAKFTLVCADEELLSSHNARVQKFFHDHLNILGVKLIMGHKVAAAATNHLLLDDGSSLKTNFVTWAINAGSKPWTVDSGLACDKHGFVQVDQFLRSISHRDIFAVGDSAAFTPMPLPKAGVYAVRQGPILTHNIVATFRRRTLRPYKPQHHFLSLLTTGGRYAVASRGPFFIKGKWVWQWKNFVDRRFMARFNLKPMAVKSSAGVVMSETMRCGGCGAKVSSSVLQNVLAQLNIKSNTDVVSELGDDAAIINPPVGMQWVQSVDFFRSFIDDPYLFGRVAANHGLGDIYAMGAKPHSALVTAVIPYGHPRIMQETLLHVMQGALRVLDEEEAVLVGGHSGEGPELAFGLTVNGSLKPGQALTKVGLNHGDSLILTKPLGTGVLLAANMAARCEGRWLDNVLSFMLQSNRNAAAILQKYGARSCTDITGFGLLGHAREMLTASQCGAVLTLNAIPILDGALQCNAAGVRSTLFNANKAAHDCQGAVNQYPMFPLLFDPQTAGGLLAGISADQTESCLHALIEADYTAAKIGVVDQFAPVNSIIFN